MITKHTALALALAVTASLTACNDSNTTSNMADSNPTTADVASRQTLMKDWRSAHDTLRAMTDNPASFDVATTKEQTQFLVDSSAKMWQHFSDSAAKGQASETIWSDPTAFQAATDEYNAAVLALNAAAQTATTPADIEVALARVNESCGSCHKSFRVR